MVAGHLTTRFSRRHKEYGHLFSGRYKALVVDGSGTGCLQSVCNYVHLKPSAAGAWVMRSFEPNCWSKYASCEAQKRKDIEKNKSV